MKISIDYINIKIPIIRFCKKSKQKYHIADNVRVGSIVITRDCLDVGWVGKVDNGKPIKIYGRCCNFNDKDGGYPCYGDIENITWYDTGIWMVFKDWKHLSEQYNATEFYNYWRNKVMVK